MIAEGLFRIVGMDGAPHPVLDAPYDSMEAALDAAEQWSDSQGNTSSLDSRAIEVEVLTQSGSWRTVGYPSNSLQSRFN